MSRSTLRGSAITAEIRKAQAAAATPVDPKAAKKNAKDKAAAAAAPKGAGEIRIIGGQWKRTRLPVAQRPGLRPTPDRVRETLFNWLGQDLGGWHCIDLCAGTGALGLEAASRGAASVLLVEQHAALVRQLRELKALLGADAVQVRQGDALAVLRETARRPGSIDLLLLDPPYDADWYAQALHAARPVLRAGGYLYLEAGREWTQQELDELGWQRWRHLKAGQVHAHLLQAP